MQEDVIEGWMRQVIAGETPDIDPDLALLSERHAYRQFEGFVSKYKPDWLRDSFTVRSAKYSYVETVDWLASIGNSMVAGLLTTRHGVYPEMAMRPAAVRYADDMPKVDRYAILHIRPRYSRLIPVEHLNLWFAAYLGWRGAGMPDLSNF
jgi:hypothetical protein